MKKIILLLGLLLVTFGFLADVGWEQIRKKENFKDSVNFVKNATFRSTVIFYDSASIGDIALLREISFNNQTASYELEDADAEKMITMSVAGANTLTVPPNSEHPFKIGTTITVISIGTGQTTIVAHAGVTVSSAGGALKLSVQYSSCTLVKVGTDLWYCVGDISL